MKPAHTDQRLHVLATEEDHAAAADRPLAPDEHDLVVGAHLLHHLLRHDEVSIGVGARMRGPPRGTLLQGSHGWHPGPDRGSRAALRLTRDVRLALQAEPGPTPPHPGAEAQGHELARLRREPAPARQL